MFAYLLVCGFVRQKCTRCRLFWEKRVRRSIIQKVSRERGCETCRITRYLWIFIASCNVHERGEPSYIFHLWFVKHKNFIRLQHDAENEHAPVENALRTSPMRIRVKLATMRYAHQDGCETLLKCVFFFFSVYHFKVKIEDGIRKRFRN